MPVDRRAATERRPPMSTWLITGCSTGLGRALAEAVLEARRQRRRHRARRREGQRPRGRATPQRALAPPSTSPTPSRSPRPSQQAEERFGGIDVLVNNAGYGYRAAVEEGDDADVHALFDTNFFGTVAMIKAVLPGMRARRSGAIVNISSIGATAVPGGLRLLLRHQGGARRHDGVAAQRGRAPGHHGRLTVEPGAFRTDFAGRSLVQSATPIDDYADTAGKRRKENDTMHGTQAGDPAKAAHAIITAVESSQPPAFLLLGPDALALYRYTVDTRSVELADWEELTTSTSLGP